MSQQCDDKDFRGPSWRRQFPPRDVHGISMMPGSAETLPAGFRLTATSGHSRRLPPDGKPAVSAPPISPRIRPNLSFLFSSGRSAVLNEALDDVYLDWF